MKVKTKLFKSVIKAAATVAAKKSAFHDVENIKLHITENDMYIVSGDLNNAYRGTVTVYDGAAIDEDMLISPAVVKFISKIPTKLNITEISLTEYTIIINGCTFPRLNAENYPDYNFADNYTPVFEIGADDYKDFTKKIKTLSTFTSKRECKLVLMGMNFASEESNIYLTAIDGYRAAKYRLPVKGDINSCDFTLNPKFAEISQHFSGAILFEDGKKHIRIMSEIGMFIVRKIDGEFFNINRSTPRNFIATCEISVDDIAEKVKAVTTIAISKEKHPIVFDFENMQITYKNSLGHMSADINGNYDGIKIKIGFNHEFLIDMLNVYSEKVITLKLSGDISPMVVDDGEIMTLTLPVRIKD